MLRYMLDTNICIELMKNQPPQVLNKFETCFVGEVVMSVITFAELQYGVQISENPNREQANLKELIEDINLIYINKFEKLTKVVTHQGVIAYAKRKHMIKDILLKNVILNEIYRGK